MTCNIEIVKTSDFVKLDPEGHFDFEASRGVLASLAKACIDRGINCALLDVRDIHGDLSTTELYTLARTFQDMGYRREHRLAVLHRLFGTKAEIFATFAAERGWNVRAFDSYEEAMEWFTTAHPLDEQ